DGRSCHGSSGPTGPLPSAGLLPPVPPASPVESGVMLWLILSDATTDTVSSVPSRAAKVELFDVAAIHPILLRSVVTIPSAFAIAFFIVSALVPGLKRTTTIPSGFLLEADPAALPAALGAAPAAVTRPAARARAADAAAMLLMTLTISSSLPGPGALAG